MARCWSMVVLATEARKVSVEDAISLDRAVRFRENAGGRSGNNRRSYRDISMTARKKPARLEHECLALNRMPKMRREDETRGWRFPGKTGSDVCLGRVGGRPHNLVERPQINNTRSAPDYFYSNTGLLFACFRSKQSNKIVRER